MKRTVAYQSIRNGLRVDFPRGNRPPASCGTIVCADYSVDTNPPVPPDWPPASQPNFDGSTVELSFTAAQVEEDTAGCINTTSGITASIGDWTAEPIGLVVTIVEQSWTGTCDPQPDDSSTITLVGANYALYVGGTISVYSDISALLWSETIGDIGGAAGIVEGPFHGHFVEGDTYYVTVSPP